MHIDRIADAHRHKQTPQQPAATTSRGRSRGLRPQANKLIATRSHRGSTGLRPEADKLTATRSYGGSTGLRPDADKLTATRSYGGSRGLKADANTLTATTNRGGSGGLGPPGRHCGPRRSRPTADEQGRPARGRYWDRTSDLLGVNEALSR